MQTKKTYPSPYKLLEGSKKLGLNCLEIQGGLKETKEGLGNSQCLKHI